MSMLWIRGPAMRKEINRISEQAFKWMNETRFNIIPADKIFDEYDRKTGKKTSPEAREKIREMMVTKNYSVELTNELHLRTFENMKGYANLFYHQNWTVYISTLSKKFVTTDNPLVIEFPKTKHKLPPTFLERIHYFALTPDICIVAREANNDLGKNLKRKTLFRGEEKQVLELNIKIASQAQQYTYARDTQDLGDILAEVKRQQEFFATPLGKTVKAKLDAERGT